VGKVFKMFADATSTILKNGKRIDEGY